VPTIRAAREELAKLSIQQGRTIAANLMLYRLARIKYRRRSERLRRTQPRTGAVCWPPATPSPGNGIAPSDAQTARAEPASMGHNHKMFL
jgi:hypothetical protein